MSRVRRGVLLGRATRTTPPRLAIGGRFLQYAKAFEAGAIAESGSRGRMGHNFHTCKIIHECCSFIYGCSDRYLR